MNFYERLLLMKNETFFIRGAAGTESPQGNYPGAPAECAWRVFAVCHPNVRPAPAPGFPRNNEPSVARDALRCREMRF
jgi:hypothetical protein